MISFLYNVVEHNKTSMLKSDLEKYAAFDKDGDTLLNSFKNAVVTILRETAISTEGTDSDQFFSSLANNSLVKAIRDILEIVNNNMSTDSQYLQKLASKKDISEQELMELNLSKKYGTIDDFNSLVTELETWINKLQDWD